MSKFKLLGVAFALSFLLPAWAAAQAPAITTAPVAQAIAPASNATFTVVASGAATLTYQWKKDGGSLTDATGHISGSTTASLTITAATTGDAGSYSVLITNGSGSIESTPVNLAVLSPVVAADGSSVTTTGFVASWQAVTGATGYQIDVSTSRAFSNNPPAIPNTYVTGFQAQDVGNTLSVPVTGLAGDTTYFYRIRPYTADAVGASSTLSSTIVVRTAATASATPQGITLLNETFPNATANPISDVNAGLSTDTNGYLVPTATQAAWYTGGTTNINYLTGTLMSISASSSPRAYLAYFEPSTSTADLAVGEGLSVTVRLKYTEGTGASAAGDFRLALLDSNGNGTAVNVADSTNSQNPARFTSQSLSATNSAQARGYSGYVVETTASQSAPAADPVSFWLRSPATAPNVSGGTGIGSSQWVGPATTSSPGTLSTLAQPNTTFTPVGVAGGGTVTAMTNDGRDYLLQLTVRRVSATQNDLSFTLTSGGSVLWSHSASQTDGTLITSFDTVFIFSQFNSVPTVLGLRVARLPAVPTIGTQPAGLARTVGGSATFTVDATSSDTLSYQWQKRPSGGSFADVVGATAATLTLSDLTTDDAADYRVIVSNSGGSTTSDAATLDIGPAPDAPVGADGADLTSSGFTASWSAVSGATGYRLDVSTSATFDTFVTGYQDLDVGTDLSRVVTDLTASTAYYYRVRAVNIYGTGASSPAVQVTTLEDTGPVTSETILNETFPLPTPDVQPIANINAGLATDTNGFPIPTSTQAAYASFGSANITYTNGTSLALSSSASARGLIAYFEPSTSVASLAVGETLTAKVTFSLSGGTPVDRVGNLRFALLNSGGNGQATNLDTLSARYASGVSNSLTGQPTGNTARGYYGYIVNSEAASSATTDTLSFWQRTAAADSGSGSTQLVGPTSSDLAASGTFAQIGAYGGGAVGTLANDATVYVATLSVKYVSATEVDLSYDVKTGDTTVMSYSASQTSGTLTTSFDSLAFFSIYGPAPTISGLEISRALVAPAIGTQPQSASVTVGENVTLSVVATGSAPLTYQWKKGGATLLDASGHISGATTASLTLTNVQNADADDYTVVVGNATGSVTSDPATLSVSAVVLPPSITTQPQAVTAPFGGSANFSVVAAGTPPLSYQWLKGGEVIDGATSQTLALTGLTAADAASYSVVVTNNAGDVTSNAVALTVTPAIVTAPKSQTGFTGGTVTFNVVATGTGPFTYQWKKGGTAIDGATSPSLTLTNLSDTDVGSYVVVVSDDGGSITSGSATLAVNSALGVTTPTLPTIRAAVYNILDFVTSGAPLPAGAHSVLAAPPSDYATAIQSAIDTAFGEGGGTVEIPAGTYLSGPLTLRSGINLQIDGGATLQALPYGTYPGSTNFITIPGGTTDVSITGAGTIEGDGTAWWTAYDLDSSVGRPRLIQFNGATRVLVSGITLQNSPQFHLALSGANSQVTITGLTISAPADSPNTDGIDPSGSNILIQNCSIAVGDDNIAIKPGSTSCSKLTVGYCSFGTGHGLSVGGQTNAGLDGLTVTNCSFTGTTSGLRLKADATEGGLVQNVTYSSITMTNVAYPIVFYSYYNETGTPGTTGGSAVTPATVNTRNAQALGGTAIPQWKNITINTLNATGASGYSIIWGLPLKDALFDGVTLTDVKITGGAGFKVYNATNVLLTGTTSVGTLTTGNAVVITAQPADRTVSSTASGTFSITAAGTSGIDGTAPTYHWNLNGAAITEGLQPDGSTITGTTTSLVTIDQARLANAGAYSCTVTNQLDGYASVGGSFAAGAITAVATSKSGSLTVNYPDPMNTPTIPTITTAVQAQVVTQGSTATFTVVASDASAVTGYQWKKDGVLLTDGAGISGTTTATLTITDAQAASEGTYTALVWNEAGAATSGATLTVHLAPVITTQPAGPGSAVEPGSSVSLSVAATGSEPFTYQWSKDGEPLADADGHIAGATTATLELSAVTGADSGSYTVTVTNDAGEATSDTATVTVRTPPPAPVANAATDITTGRFLASWNAASTATSYRLDVSATSDFASFVTGYQDLNVGSSLSQYVSGLTAGTTYYFRVRGVNDLGAGDSSAAITVDTLPVSLAPTITSPSRTTFTVGLACTFTVTASASPAATFQATGLPSWLSLNATTGVLSGTAPAGTEGASLALVLTASNGVAPSGSQAFTLKVEAAPGATTALTVTTIAGTAGERGNTDGTGSFARFNHPSGIAVDHSGNIDVADTDNFMIRQIDSSNAVTRLLGTAGISGSDTGAIDTAKFAAPTAIAFDSGSAGYIADSLNDTIVGLGTASTSRFVGLVGVAGSTDGDATAATFDGPQGVVAWSGVVPGESASRDFVFVADTNNHTIRRIEIIRTPKGNSVEISYAITTFAGLAGHAGSADGTGTAARFNAPSAIAVDRSGNLYVADTDNNTVRVVTELGEVRTLAGLAGSNGAADGTGSAARFHHPAALTVDSSYRVYVLDTDNHTVRRITPAGQVTTVAGTAGKPGSADGTGSAARFRNPTGITQAADGSFYIADTNNHTIRRGVFPLAPKITKQPQSLAVTVGATALFGVTATGEPEPSYQWLHDGKTIDGATAATLSLSNAQIDDGGQYSVVVSNESGSVTSDVATLTVSAAPASGGVNGGGGGGGAPGGWFFLALALLAGARRCLRRRTAPTLGSL